MLSDPFKKERRVVAFQLEALAVGETWKYWSQTLPSAIRTDAPSAFELIVERGVRKVSVEKWLGKLQWHPCAIDGKRLLGSKADAFQKEQISTFFEPQVTRCLGVLCRTEIQYRAGLGYTGRFDGAKQAVQPTEGLFELGTVHDRASTTLSAQDAGLIEVPDRLSNGVSRHVVAADELGVSRKPVIELACFEASTKFGF